VKGLDEAVAEVQIEGEVIPSTSADPLAPGQGGVSIVVRGGRCAGECAFDRASGLPIRSRNEQLMDMIVRMDGQGEFLQQKRTVTTLEVKSPSSDADADRAALASDPGPRAAPMPQRIAGDAKAMPR
jgi:hypothetical protein